MSGGPGGSDELSGPDGPDGQDDGFDWSVDADDVFFLDEDGAGGLDGELGDESWLGEERLHGGRDGDRSLPPMAAPSRVLASLVALAVFLGCTGAAFTSAYHRHVTDRRIANTLALAAASSPPRIPGLAALSFQQLWHAQLEEQVVIAVVNRSPDPVALLGGVLEEPGMTTAANFEPVGSTRLAPGQTGHVAGEITVDCTQDPAAVFPYMDSSGSSTVPLPNAAALLVRARTEGGDVGEASLNPDSNGPDLQLRICQQEGFDITGPPTIYAIGDARTHSVEVNLVVASSADVTLGYRAMVAFARQDAYGVIPGLPDTSAPEPVLPAIGLVASGGTIHVSFAIKVLSCPIHPQEQDGLYVELTLTAGGNAVDALEESTALALPLSTACGEA